MLQLQNTSDSQTPLLVIFNIFLTKRTGQCGTQITRDSVNTQAITAIGSQFNLDNIIIEYTVFIEIFTHNQLTDTLIEDHNSLTHRGESNLFSRADHAV